MDRDVLIALGVLAACAVLAAWILSPARVVIARTPAIRRAQRFARQLFTDDAVACPRCARPAEYLGGSTVKGSAWYHCAPCGHAWPQARIDLDPSPLTSAADPRVEHLRPNGSTGRRGSGTGHSHHTTY